MLEPGSCYTLNCTVAGPYVCSAASQPRSFPATRQASFTRAEGAGRLGRPCWRCAAGRRQAGAVAGRMCRGCGKRGNGSHSWSLCAGAPGGARRERPRPARTGSCGPQGGARQRLGPAPRGARLRAACAWLGAAARAGRPPAGGWRRRAGARARAHSRAQTNGWGRSVGWLHRRAAVKTRSRSRAAAPGRRAACARAARRHRAGNRRRGGRRPGAPFLQERGVSRVLAENTSAFKRQKGLRVIHQRRLAYAASRPRPNKQRGHAPGAGGPQPEGAHERPHRAQERAAAAPEQACAVISFFCGCECRAARSPGQRQEGRAAAAKHRSGAARGAWESGRGCNKGGPLSMACRRVRKGGVGRAPT